MSQHIKKLTLALPLLLIAAGLYYFVTMTAGDVSPQKTIDDEIKKIYKTFHVNVIYKNTEQYIPDLWKLPPGEVSTTPVDLNDLKQLISILPKELSKYPKDILQENLTHIIVLGELKFSNTSYGGTYMTKSVYIPISLSINDEYLNYLSGTLHHELSSILFHRYKFQKKPWAEINSPDFAYAKTGEDKLKAIKGSTGLKGNSQLYINGFLTGYNQVTLENDFNRYAEFAFTRPATLVKLSMQYPRIRQKILLLKNFYLSISKDFAPIMAECCNV